MTKLRLILISSAAIAFVTLFFLWRNASNNLANTQQCLTEAQQTIESLKRDNDNLIAYNAKRDSEIKNLQKEYDTILQNIPKDACGDQKPSDELLQYFRKNVK